MSKNPAQITNKKNHPPPPEYTTSSEKKRGTDSEDYNM